MKKGKIKLIIVLFLVFSINEGCVSPYYNTKYMAKTMHRFSVPKRTGMQKHFLKKGKKKLNPSYTKHVRDYYSN